MNREYLSVALVSSFLLGGCAYVDPMVGVVKRASKPDDDSNSMPLLKAAIANLDGRIESLEEKRDQTIKAGRWLDVVTFGFGTGAAGAALNANHANAVKNLTFGTAATYGASTLFTARDAAMVYNSGLSALSCVSDKATSLRDAVVRYRARRESDRSLPGSLIPAGCSLTPDQGKLAAAAYAANARVDLALAYAEGSDLEEANRVTKATNGVIGAVNAQILAKSNSPDAVLGVLSGLKPSATGTTLQTTQSFAAAAASRGGEPCSEDVSENLARHTSTYSAIEKRITDVLNAMGTLDTACVVGTTTVEALSLSQEEVTIAKDAVVNVVITGGRPPYAILPIGTQTNDVTIQLIPPRTIVITGKSSISGKTGPFEYQITDNSVISSPKKLKVSTTH